MDEQTLLDLKEAQKILQELARSLTELSRDPAVSCWERIDVEEHKDILLGMIGNRMAEVATSDTALLSSLVEAQKVFRLHAFKTSHDDILQVTTHLRNSIDKAAEAIISEQDGVLNTLYGRIPVHEKQVGKLMEHGNLLKTTYGHLVNFSLVDLVMVALARAETMEYSEKKAFLRGRDMLSRINAELARDSEEGVISAESCLGKAEEAERALIEKIRLLNDLKDATNDLVMLVLKEGSLDLLSIVLVRVRKAAESLRRQVESLNKPVMEVYTVLKSSSSTLGLREYFAEVDKQRLVLIRKVILLGRMVEIITWVETMTEVLTEILVFLSRLDDLSSALKKTVSEPQSVNNPAILAAMMRHEYYSEGLWLMLKRMLSRPLPAEKIIKTINACPVLYGLQREKKVKGLRESPELQSFLTEQLVEYEPTWVYQDVARVLKKSIETFTSGLYAFIKAYPVSSSLVRHQSLGALLDSIHKKTDSLET